MVQKIEFDSTQELNTVISQLGISREQVITIIYHPHSKLDYELFYWE